LKAGLIGEESRTRNRTHCPRQISAHFFHRQLTLPPLNSCPHLMNERYAHWWTPQMSRDFEMLIFGDGRKRCGHDWNYWRDMLPPYLSTI
jgi:hypothetical protein